MIIKGEPIKPKLAKIALFKIISKWYGDKSNTQKGRSKSFLFNVFSVFQTIAYTVVTFPYKLLCYFTLLCSVTIMFMAPKQLGIPVSILILLHLGQPFLIQKKTTVLFLLMWDPKNESKWNFITQGTCYCCGD